MSDQHRWAVDLIELGRDQSDHLIVHPVAREEDTEVPIRVFVALLRKYGNQRVEELSDVRLEQVPLRSPIETSHGSQILVERSISLALDSIPRFGFGSRIWLRYLDGDHVAFAEIGGVTLELGFGTNLPAFNAVSLPLDRQVPSHLLINRDVEGIAAIQRLG